MIHPLFVLIHHFLVGRQPCVNAPLLLFLGHRQGVPAWKCLWAAATFVDRRYVEDISAVVGCGHGLRRVQLLLHVLVGGFD